MRESEDSSTFSQRSGLMAVPPQLELGQLSAALRNQLHYPVQLDFAQCVRSGGYGATPWIEGRWLTILRDHRVLVRGENVSQFDTGPSSNERFLQDMFQKAPFNMVFDFIEFLLRHSATLSSLKTELASVLVRGRAAYRIVDGSTVIPVGPAEQAQAIERAVADARGEAPGAAAHLLAAGSALRLGNWASSVRESIHAVEAVAVRLAPGKDTLGDALGALERQGHLHGALKKALGALYGYTSDEEGIRHALVFADKAQVDEADALFMLGACASFVSYLLERAREAS